MHLIDHRELNEAQRILEEKVKAVPDYPKAWGTLSVFFAKQENPTRAEECYRRALSLDSNQNFARIALGPALLAQDRLQESLEQFRSAVCHSGAMKNSSSRGRGFIRHFVLSVCNLSL